MSSRREARERAMQGLYALEMTGADPEHIINSILRNRLGSDKESLDFAISLFIRTIEHTTEADEIVSKYTKNWELSRIALVDRILLRIGIAEMLAFEDVPPKVTINEMIEVAKGFSTARSGQFINGILDTVLVDLKKENRLNKRGRGLIGMESGPTQE
jgi:transcription antitermination protein NusB